MFWNILQLLLPTIILITTIRPSKTVLRTWTGGTNALLTTSGTNCKGLILPAHYQSVIYLATSTISELVLPKTGSVSFQEGAKLIFDEKDKSCTKIFLQKTSTNRPENWDTLPNRAVPYLDRIPCQWDDIYIPEGNPIGIDFAIPFLAKSVRVRDRNLQINNDNTILHLGFDVVPHNQCTMDTCVCQFPSYYVNHCEEYRQLLDEQHEGIDKDNEEVRLYWESLQMMDEVFCEKPIEVERACSRICGATVVIRGRDGDVRKLKKRVEEILEREQKNGVEVDFYSGLILNKRERYIDKRLNIQVVIVDKMAENGGRDSLTVVRKLEKELEQVYIDGEYSYLIQQSGTPIIQASFFKSGVGMLFITFLLTILLFASIYVIFMTSLNNRFLRMTHNFPPVLSARFKNLRHLQYGDGEADEDAILSCREVDISLTAPMVTSTTMSASSVSATTAESFSSTSSTMLLATAIEEATIVDNAKIVALERRDREFDNPLYNYAKHELVEVDVEDRREDGCSQMKNAKKVNDLAKKKNLMKHKRHNSFEQLLRVDDEEQANVAGIGGDDKREPEVKVAAVDNPEVSEWKHGGQQQSKRDEGKVELLDDLDEVERKRESTHEMLKFIEENMQQVSLLDDQL